MAAYDNKKAKTLTHFLRRINTGEDPILLRKQAYQLLTNVEPVDIARGLSNIFSVNSFFF